MVVLVVLVLMLVLVSRSSTTSWCSRLQVGGGGPGQG